MIMMGKSSCHIRVKHCLSVLSLGLLHEGDEILDIDGIEMKGKDINEVSDMLVSKNRVVENEHKMKNLV